MFCVLLITTGLGLASPKHCAVQHQAQHGNTKPGNKPWVGWQSGASLKEAVYKAVVQECNHQRDAQGDVGDAAQDDQGDQQRKRLHGFRVSASLQE